MESLSWFERMFPGLALKRAANRHALAELKGARLYDAAKSSAYRLPITDRQSGDAVMEHAQDKLRIQARNADENNDLAIGILDTLVNNVVGAGLSYEPLVKNADGSVATELNRAIGRAWGEWRKRAEASRQLPWSELERVVARSWLRDGEYLVQHVIGTRAAIRHRGPVPYSIELIEADFLPFADSAVNRDGVIHGVEVNAWGEPIAYHLYKEHPGNLLISSLRASLETKRVPAERLTHLKFARRHPQIRGVTCLHGVLIRLDDLKEYELSERIAARVAAAFCAVITKQPSFTRQAKYAAGNRDFEMHPGMVFDRMVEGESVEVLDPKRPNAQLGQFRRDQLRAAAAGAGTSASTISRNYEGSYSSQRQELSETAVGYQKLRAYFIDVFAREVYERFVGLGDLSGLWRYPPTVDPVSILDCDIRGPSSPWIDPEKEMKADVLAVQAGFKGRHQVIRERGGDPVSVDEMRAQDTEGPEPEPAQDDEGGDDAAA